jgi:hypothetical protein
VCSQNCDDRCFGTEPNECCHPECAAGCDGSRKTDCFVCFFLSSQNIASLASHSETRLSRHLIETESCVN